MNANHDHIAFVPAKITQLKANHSRVPKQVTGWGLSAESIKPGVQYWIFDERRNESEDFYWMHTNIIIEMQREGHQVVFQTASGSIYQVDYNVSDQVFKPSEYKLFLMTNLVREAHKIWRLKI